MDGSLILVAAGGLARESVAAAEAQGRYRPIGFLDDRADLRSETIANLPVLGGISALTRYPGSAVALCAGSGADRERLAARLRQRGVSDSRLAVIQHPTTPLTRSVAVGPGCILLANCALTADVSLGRNVVCMPNVTLTHDDVVADYVTLCAGVALGGAVSVGTRSYLGMNSCVREGVRIGADCIIGMGAVVLRDVPDGQTWVGNPARPIVAAAGRLTGALAR